MTAEPGDRQDIPLKLSLPVDVHAALEGVPTYPFGVASGADRRAIGLEKRVLPESTVPSSVTDVALAVPEAPTQPQLFCTGSAPGSLHMVKDGGSMLDAEVHHGKLVPGR